MCKPQVCIGEPPGQPERMYTLETVKTDRGQEWWAELCKSTSGKKKETLPKF